MFCIHSYEKDGIAYGFNSIERAYWYKCKCGSRVISRDMPTSNKPVLMLLISVCIATAFWLQ